MRKVLSRYLKRIWIMENIFGTCGDGRGMKIRTDVKYSRKQTATFYIISILQCAEKNHFTKIKATFHKTYCVTGLPM
jgi:hypothetical protein